MTPLTGTSSLSIRQRYAWDARYRMKGRQWGNAPVFSLCSDDSGVILELGVGDGKNLRCRSGSDAVYIGIDYSREAIRICRKDTSLDDFPLLLADACSLPVRDNVVFRVFAHHILGHIPAVLEQDFINEIYRVLSPGGLVVLTVFAKGDMRDKSGYEIEPSTYLRGDGIITRYYSEEMIQALGAGYCIREIHRVEWPMRIRGKQHIRAEYTVFFEKE